MGNLPKHVIAVLYRAIKGTVSPFLLALMAVLAIGCTGEDKAVPVYVYAGEADTDTDADTDSDSDADSDTDSDTDVPADDSGDTDVPVDTGCEATTWYLDADGDGFGDSQTGHEDCDAPTDAYVEDDNDCDDTDAGVNPSALEVCDESDVDENCDGTADDDSADGATVWFADVDGDGVGTTDTFTVACDVPDGYTDEVNDCDDADPTAYPGGTEICDGVDNDCDGDTDEDDATDAPTWYEDVDSDGFGDADSSQAACTVPSGYVADDTDCDDAQADVNPDASESCNGEDDDCDGTVDETSAIDATTWYLDLDSDGWGDSGVSYVACTAPGGYVADDADCDDGDASVGDHRDWYADADGDEYGDASSSTEACDQPTGYVADNTDCDDTSTSYNPGADESDCADPADYNCDGSSQYADADGDGYAACEDCDDGADEVNDDATETCDGIDNDCNGVTDQDATDQLTWYFDDDDDGYGLSTSTTESCDQPEGYAAVDGDCDDADEEFNPGADESDCTDANDYNCDGSVGYTDADGDGFAACEDCDDSEAVANADEVETCDGIDNDCDSAIDESGATGETTWYLDADGDGYGTGLTIDACDQPSGYVDNGDDCQDDDEDSFPGSAEYCDEVDNDCDGATDESDAVDVDSWFLDADGDGFGDDSMEGVESCVALVGYVQDDTDCDDGDEDVNTEVDEVCDGADNDCDGETDEDSATDALDWYVDRDEDGYGRSGASASYHQCDDPSTSSEVYASNDDDCSDTNDTVNPAANEVSEDGLDNDCDGETDE